MQMNELNTLLSNTEAPPIMKDAWLTLVDISPTHKHINTHIRMPIFQNTAIFSVECRESVSKVIIFQSAVMSVGKMGGRFHRESALRNMKQAIPVQWPGLSGEGRVGGNWDIISVRNGEQASLAVTPNQKLYHSERRLHSQASGGVQSSWRSPTSPVL